MDLRELWPEAKKAAEDTVRTICNQIDAENPLAGELRERRNALQAALDKALHQRGDVNAKIDDARRRRGEHLADGSSMAAIDKEMCASRSERERLHDLVAALSERIADVSREFSSARIALLNVKTEAMGAVLEEAKTVAMEAQEKAQIAVAMRDALQRRVEAFAVGVAIASR